MAAIPAGVALTSATVPAAAAANVVTVRMHEFKFCSNSACTQDKGKGDVVTVHTGDVVKWVWDESAKDLAPNCDLLIFQLPLPVNCPGHTTTSSTAGADGKPLWNSGTCAAPDGHAAPGAAGCPFSVTYNTPGSFGYFCVFHGGTKANNPVTKMNGLIVVQGPPLFGNQGGNPGGGQGGGVDGSGSGPGAPDATAVSADSINAFVPGLPDTGAGSQHMPISAVAIALALTMTGAAGAAFALLPRRH